MSNIVAEPKSRAEIAKYANIIRKIAGCNNGYFDVVKFIEYQAVDIFGIEFEILAENSKKLEDNEYAKFVPSENKIYVRERVYERALNNFGQDRFTLAHELGHAIFHKQQALSRSSFRPPAYKDPEWQANEFASCVLCPLIEIRKLTVEEIMKIYKVSRQVAFIQLKKIGE